MKGAPDADNGKKLIDFLLSKDAQSTVTSVALGVPVRMDVKPTDKAAMLQDTMKGVNLVAGLGGRPQGPAGRRRSLARATGS